MANAAGDCDCILLKLHSSATTKTKSSSRQGSINV
jgi:hypothetical protein